jgi:osmotically inducible protein OsmC
VASRHDSSTRSYLELVGRGRGHRVLGSYDLALADFTAAHAARPAAARPLFERGAISILLGRYNDALADYHAAVTREPAYPGAASYFAELYLYTGRAGAALVTSLRANRDEPANLVHRVNVAHAFLLLGDAARAAREYDAIADDHDRGKGVSGAAIALADLALMRAAGIDAPGMRDIEVRLRARHTTASTRQGTVTMAATATATWAGTLDDGSGTMSTATGLTGAFTKASRFADGSGTNPEELLGAAHAGCFSQFLALLLSQNDTPPNSIETTARVSIVVGDDGPTINRIALSTVVDADVSADQITTFANQAKHGCPVSKALTGVAEITLAVAKA